MTASPDPAPPLDPLPDGWTARVPDTDDVAGLVDLLAAHRRQARGDATADPETVAAWVTGAGSWTRRQLVVDDASGATRAWAWVHDRAAGRTVVDVTVSPDLSDEDGDRVAEVLFAWAEAVGREMAKLRLLDETQLDATAYADDTGQRRRLERAGYRMTRTWLQMSRNVDDGPSLPHPREGVTVRPVARHDDGMPLAQDIQVVHQMLEESFADHFNSYRESFPEFLQRLREDPGHRWDHWWVAEIDVDGEVVPGGALVGSVMSPDPSGVEGSYVDYIGVHRRARGRGVAKALLRTVIRDAHDRGRNRVDLEVDADSPTGADGLYTSMGWVVKYRTESWHADCRA